ncbi:3-oxoacyl-[acyl-carrier-protein] synthase III C-terminal domain-containing protein [Kitasatospora sp. NPDC004272]
MRFDAVYLSAPATVLGEGFHTREQAVADALISAQDAERYGYRGLPTAAAAPVELAERAARRTLAEAGVPAADLGALLHAWTHHQGHEFWSPAHYLADRLGAAAAVPLGIQQMCNGGLTAVDRAARDLAVEPGAGPALVTTADCFPAPGFDRWGGDYGVAYGDGATSVLVDRVPHAGAVRLLSVATVAVAALEGMHRGNAPFTPTPVSGTKTLLPRVSKKEFRALRPELDFGPVACRAVVDVVGRALSDARVAPDDARLRAAGLPRLARHVVDGPYRLAFLAACSAPVVDLGGDTGHLGAGDAVANLADLLATGAAGPGELLVLLSAGAGFTWSAAVVEVM